MTLACRSARCFVLMLCLLLVFLIHGSRSLAEDVPNFVWLISEDNSKHYLKLFDRHGVETPNIKSLAKSGLVFRHAFSNSPVCSVARTTLLTGCYAPRIGAQYHRRSKLVPMPKGVKPFPQTLREAGYYTTNRRKTDYNIIAGKKVWDESSNRASWRNRKQGQPFFHKQSFATSHEGSLHFSKATMLNQPTQTDPTKVVIAPYHPDTKTFRYTYARYHDRIQLVDQQMGRVIDQLKQDQLLDSTFIFYFGDHGGVLPRGKGYAYESGLHIPLVIHVPKKFRHLVDAKPGSTVDGFVSFIDFGPTLLNLAGIEIPMGIDGRPFLGPRVKQSDVDQRKTAFGYADRFDEKYDLVRTLRHKNYKYIRNYQPFNFDGLQNNYRYKMLAYQEWRSLFQEGKLNQKQSHFFRARQAEELYDLEQDPYETVNLADSPKYKDALLELRGQLSEHVKRTRDLSMFPESYLYEHAFADPTGFGKSNQETIAELVNIADLSLKSFVDVEDKLKQAIKSGNPWHRYWAMIVCSCHGKQAASLYDVAKNLAQNDGNRLVRIRAAEFLALTGKMDPGPVFKTVLQQTKSGVEACLILNSLVMLRDGPRSCQFDILKSDLQESVLNDGNVKRRLIYLTEIK